jgi:hypothetical protein
VAAPCRKGEKKKETVRTSFSHCRRFFVTGKQNVKLIERPFCFTYPEEKINRDNLRSKQTTNKRDLALYVD